MIEKEEIVFRACQALVGLFRDQVESGKKICIHTRIFTHILHPEIDYVQCGVSSKLEPGEKFHPEHVVPCKVLIEETCRLIRDGTLSHDQIAGLLQNHWKIAKISKDEARRLDSDLKLKSSMPGKWRFEDGDTLARLQVADILIVPD